MSLKKKKGALCFKSEYAETHPYDTREEPVIKRPLHFFGISSLGYLASEDPREVISYFTRASEDPSAARPWYLFLVPRPVNAEYPLGWESKEGIHNGDLTPAVDGTILVGVYHTKDHLENGHVKPENKSSYIYLNCSDEMKSKIREERDSRSVALVTRIVRQQFFMKDRPIGESNHPRKFEGDDRESGINGVN
jgi:hypothetical protein